MWTVSFDLCITWFLLLLLLQGGGSMMVYFEKTYFMFYAKPIKRWTLLPCKNKSINWGEIIDIDRACLLLVNSNRTCGYVLAFNGDRKFKSKWSAEN